MTVSWSWAKKRSAFARGSGGRRRQLSGLKTVNSFRVASSWSRSTRSLARRTWTESDPMLANQSRRVESSGTVSGPPAPRFLTEVEMIWDRKGLSSWYRT